jgi:hypothetical protein
MGLAWQASIDAMAAALDGLIAKGYHLVTISQLIAMESLRFPLHLRHT